MKRVHLIAIGGSAMHNLALALHEKGYKVTGSDDEINEPSKSRLARAGLLPSEIGWFPGKISSGLDAVILGMHAREDNPELIKAKETGVKIFSYPEFIYEACRDKVRIVVGGSHGKTTTTAMILHVANAMGIETDYLVGAQLEGFNTMVRLSETARYAVLEGDEYLSSPIDRRPKFHLYKPHVAILTGIAWDHINVFPTFEIYLEQFQRFIGIIEASGTLIFSDTDEHLRRITEKKRPDISYISYHAPINTIENGVTIIEFEGKRYPLQIFGAHNLENINAARYACEKMGVTAHDFFKAIGTFTGAARRLQLLKSTGDFNLYHDFAHSPSKLKATTSAVREQFPGRTLVACMELHTFSSLTEEFLAQYDRSMEAADIAIVYYNPRTIAHKNLKQITSETVKKAFGRDDLLIFTDSRKLNDYLSQRDWKNSILLMMSSGTFDGLDLKAIV